MIARLLRRWLRRPLPVPLVGFIPQLRDVPCAACGQPSVGWRFRDLEDGIEGESVCLVHLLELAA